MRIMMAISFALTLTLSGCLPQPDRPGDHDGAVVVDAGNPAVDGALVPDSDAGVPDLDGAPPVDGARDAAPAVDGGTLSVAAMLTSACTAGVCTPAKVVAYWRNEWDNYAVRRTIKFNDVSAAEHRLVITDEAGRPATLELEPGIPVTLTIINPGDTGSTGKHDITAPELFRAVAWRRARTLAGEYRAAQFDSFHVRRRSGSELSVTLEFVPMNAGTFDVYCQIGVPNGNAYEAIVAGTVDPDLLATAGHAGKGARTTATIRSGLAGTITQPVAALGADPRRADTNPVWATAVRDETYRASPVRLYEFTDEEYAFLPVNLALRANIGSVIRVSNPIDNLRAHVYSAATFLAESVIRKAQDDDVEVDSSTLTSVQLAVGAWMDLFVVPSRGATYGSYCDIGVQLNPDGTPKLNTGHALRGMVGTLTVAP